MRLRHKLLSHLPYLLVLWILSLIVYLKTLPPSILYIDSGTIIAAAASLGISNPPGFPAYIMLAHLFTKLPGGTVLFRMELFSVLSALGVLTLTYYLLQRLISTNFWFVHGGKDDSLISLGGLRLHLGGGNTKMGRLCALGATLALAFSYQFWSQTLNTESYIFTNLLMISLLALVLTVPKEGKIGKRLVLGGVLLGIASGANPTIAQVIPSLLLGGIFFRKRISLARLVLACLIAVLVAGAVYAYLPLRASQHPFLNWGNPQTWDLFWGQIRGEGLNINDPRTNSINGFTGSWTIFSQSVGRYIYLLFVQFTPLLLPLIILGGYYLWQKNKKLLTFLLITPLTNLIFGGLYLSGNQESWFIGSYVIFSLFLGIGLKVLLGSLSNLGNLSYLRVVTLVLGLLPLLWWFPKLDRSSQVVTSEYAANLYHNLPEGSVLIGSGDFFNSLTNYQHEAAKERTDVFPIVANMWYILPWYRDNLRHQRPDLMPQELETMIKKDRFEEYNEVMNWYIRYLIDHGHPVFITPMVFRETVLAGTDAGKYKPDPQKLKAVNVGLSYRMLTPNDLLQPEEESFQYKFSDPQFFEHPPYYLERNYKAAYHILLQEYGVSYADFADHLLQNSKDLPELKPKAVEYITRAYQMAPFSGEIVNRVAIFTAMQGDLPGAIKYFKEAVNLEPNSLEARLNLAKALNSAGKSEEARKELQNLISLAEIDTVHGGASQIKAEAQAELAKITGKQLAQSIPENWKEFADKTQGFSFRYPGDWKTAASGRMITISNPGGDFSISLVAGKLAAGQQGEEWVKSSPLQFSGKIESKGLAQIPGFEAQASFWQEGGQKTLEFVLTQDSHVLHLKVGPADSKLMSTFDQIITSLKFEN